MFETAKNQRISHNIVQQIRRAILKGDLKPGDRLPPEKELAESFNVSKSSLREAFRALETLGLLEVRQGVSGGAFIREVDLDIVRDNIVNYIFFQNPSIREFTQVRRIFEPEIAKIAARNVTSVELAELENNLIQTKNDLDSGGFSYRLDIFFHKKIACIANNTLISLIIDSMQTALVNMKHILKPDYDFSMQVYLAHQKIFEAIRAHDPERAGAEMMQHINEVEKGLTALCEPETLVKP